MFQRLRVPFKRINEELNGSLMLWFVESAQLGPYLGQLGRRTCGGGEYLHVSLGEPGGDDTAVDRGEGAAYCSSPQLLKLVFVSSEGKAEDMGTE